MIRRLWDRVRCFNSPSRRYIYAWKYHGTPGLAARLKFAECERLRAELALREFDRLRAELADQRDAYASLKLELTTAPSVAYGHPDVTPTESWRGPAKPVNTRRLWDRPEHNVYWGSHGCCLETDHDNACTCPCGARYTEGAHSYGEQTPRVEGYESPEVCDHE